MTIRRLAPVSLIAAALLAGCGTTLDPKSGEDLIRLVVQRNSLGTVTSVSCPSGLKPNVGVVFDCRVALKDPSGQTRSGTITVHVVSGRKVAILGQSDLHLR